MCEILSQSPGYKFHKSAQNLLLISETMAKILGKTTDKEIVCADDKAVDESTPTGLVKIYEYR